MSRANRSVLPRSQRVKANGFPGGQSAVDGQDEADDYGNGAGHICQCDLIDVSPEDIQDGYQRQYDAAIDCLRLDWILHNMCGLLTCPAGTL